MKKRMWKSVMACLLLVCLLATACSSKKTESAQMNENEADYLIKVGFVHGNVVSGWNTANVESIKDTFVEENGYELVYADAEQDQEAQIAAIKDFIEQSVDYIVFSPVIENGWEDVLEEAKEAGIPVIVTDRVIDVEDSSLYEVWLGSDFEKQGENAGKWLEDYLKEKKNKKAVNIVTLQGEIGSEEQMGRTEGFGKILEENEDWTMLAQQTGEDTREKAKEVMELFLKSHYNLNVVVAENDEMALGAIEAIKEAHRTSGPKGEITVLSFDAQKEAFDAMKEGTLNATFETNPLYGHRIAEIIQKLEAGISLDKAQYIDETYFDTTMDLETLEKERTY